MTGTPTNCAITVTGNGYAKSLIRSILPFSIILFIISWPISSIVGFSLDIVLGVNAEAMRCVACCDRADQM